MRFELDTRAEQQVALLRLCAGGLSVLGALWLLAAQGGLVALAALTLAVVVTALWARSFSLSRRRTADPGGFYLELRPDALVLAEGGPPLTLPWSEIRSVALDEDALVVVVARHHGDSLRIEPRYRGIGVQDLGHAIAKAHRDAGDGVRSPRT